jgi:hypothetical protein
MSDDHENTALFPDAPLAYAILRIALGVCMLFHGASWIINSENDSYGPAPG